MLALTDSAPARIAIGPTTPGPTAAARSNTFKIYALVIASLMVPAVALAGAKIVSDKPMEPRLSHCAPMHWRP